MNLPNSDQDQAQSLIFHEVSRVYDSLSSECIGVNFKSVGMIQQLSPGFLAYLGDAVYELYVRSHYIFPPRRLADYHNKVVSLVRAESQAAFLSNLHPHLTEFEKDIVRRGRNTAAGGRRRISPELYQQATSFETLIGYLYLQNPQRLNQLLGKLNLNSA
ncbi:putative ribonuclease III [cyanobacterium endosymbiont of Epithemia turgida isolate EtSB Lake Yunoko]|nr:putative ribonuclease III [cyanobacterium endosymbiont of Epithemia turgida isolate EtSB Lake Yunoko]